MAAMLLRGASGAEAERGLAWHRWNPRVPSGPLGIRTMLLGKERRLSAGLDRPDSNSNRRRITHGEWEPAEAVEDGGLPPLDADVTTTSEQLDDLGRGGAIIIITGDDGC